MHSEDLPTAGLAGLAGLAGVGFSFFNARELTPVSPLLRREGKIG
jgi:hypothetical protein